MSLLCNAFPSREGICVNTGEVKISMRPLITSFVNTCTAIGIKFGKKNFLAHIDVMNPNMENEANQVLSKVDKTKIESIKVWKGNRCEKECPSYRLALKLLKTFDNETIEYKSTTDESIIKTT